ncbi:hypothetical protein BGX28_008147 [Mortierella sp. GBA30]|nr:hypothetical protein BGX28_008147 [Mortierella sp. GBA30]
MIVFSLYALVALAWLSTSNLTVTPRPAIAATKDPVSLDPCGILGNSSFQSNVSYEHVAACYGTIPYDANVGGSTLDSVTRLFTDYYIYRDSALTPNLTSPFASDQVDIAQQLQTIKSTNYTSDFKFHADIAAAISSLRDGIAQYQVDCYNAFLFSQNFALYAPVVNGKQAIRVLKDVYFRGYEDCVVQTIDGQDALPYLLNWSTSAPLSASKDPGVRLNEALATLYYHHDYDAYYIEPGAFGKRLTLPERESVQYSLQCANANGTTTMVNVNETWVVQLNGWTTFTDVKSYVQNVCLDLSASSNMLEQQKMWEENKELPTMKKSEKRLARRVPQRTILPHHQYLAPAEPMTGSDKLLSGGVTAFFQLRSQPDAGVVVVYSHLATDGELDLIAKGLDAFHQRGITKIIIDLQGNGGGYNRFSSALVQYFFPNKSPLDKSLESDLRDNSLVQNVTATIFNNPGAGFYDASGYIDLKTGAPYKDDALFMNPVNQTRNDRQASYTSRTTPVPFQLPSNFTAVATTYAWTNNPDRIRILTDGQCWGACAVSCHLLHSVYNVSSFAVGGIQGQDLSMFSALAGASSSLKELNQIYKLGNAQSFIRDLPYKGEVTLPVMEVYAAAGRQVPLEYDTKYFASDHHLDLDVNSARARDIQWEQVAAASWKS